MTNKHPANRLKLSRQIATILPEPAERMEVAAVGRIAHGIDVYHENDRYIVFFAGGSRREYRVGGLLFELIDDQTFDAITEKVGRMVRAFPGFRSELTRENVTEGFRWLCGTVEDEDFPVASALFESYFSETLMDVLKDPVVMGAVTCIGELLTVCHEIYMQHMKSFAVYTESLAKVNSGLADDFEQESIDDFREAADEVYDLYARKCSVRKRRGMVSLGVHNLRSPIQLLIFEYCRMRKENKAFKQCLNCGRFFIPGKRIDTKYCSLPSPQDEARSCSEIGPQLARSRKRRKDPVEKEHNRNYSRLAMAAKRAEERGEDASYFRALLRRETEQYYQEKES